MAHKLLLCVCAALAAALMAAAPAQADFGIAPGSFSVDVTDTQASGHPDITTKFELNLDSSGTAPDGLVKDIIVDVPPGLIGNPQAMPQCDPSQLDVLAGRTCPVSTQVGTANLQTSFIPVIQAPVYNMVPAEGEVAQFAFMAVLFQIQVTASIRSDDDYGLRMTILNTPTFAPLISSELTFWGVPNSPANDLERGKQCTVFGPFANCTLGMDNTPYPATGVPAQGAVVPFNLAPSKCGEATTASIRANSWGDPDTWSTAEAPVVPFDGCERMQFNPQLKVEPSTTRAGAPTGLEVDITVPQNDAPGGVATPPLDSAVVTLPEGMAVSPSAADGLGACSEAQLSIGSLSQPDCPQSSYIGRVTIDSPLQAEPMQGVIIQGTQTPTQLLRIFLYAEGGGVQLKLPGVIDADPVTGQLTATFKDQPMLAARRISLTFKDGPRAVLSNPLTCGEKTTTSRITSHGGVVATPSSSYTVEGCNTSGFNPGFAAGSDNPTAGENTNFAFALNRQSDEPEFGSIRSIGLPEGLLGNVGSVPLCEEAQAAAGTCGEASRIGHVQVAAGAGSAPLWVPQAGKAATHVYLTGPYNGAPYGLSIVVPAQAGPFDLGKVVVRNALHVDDRTTELTTGVDESRVFGPDGALERVIPGKLPRILEGIPLNLRELRVTMDRDRFMLNPTNCSPSSVGTQAVAITDLVADLSSRFRAADCAKLDFAPRFHAQILNEGRKSTLRSFHPRTRFAVVPRSGDANIGAARVILPSSILLDQANIGTTCIRADMAADNCPEASIVGYARAWSPLLQRPVQGPVYLAANGGVRPLPDLAAVMDGEIRVVLQGEISTRRGGGKARLENTFRVVPDAPVSRFVLTMRGGNNRGLLVNSTDLCRTNERGAAVFHGQNGRTHRLRPRIATRFKGCAKVRRQAARKVAQRQMARQAAVVVRRAMR